MKIYCVSTGCYSDKAYLMLTSEKIFEDDEFKELCKYICEELERKENFYSNLEEVVKVLVNRYGFNILKYPDVHLWDYSFGRPDDEINLIIKPQEWEWSL